MYELTCPKCGKKFWNNTGDCPDCGTNFDEYRKQNKSANHVDCSTSKPLIVGYEPIYSLTGCRGRNIYVYDDFAIITVDITLGSVLTGNLSDGQKIIFYKDCIGIQFKYSGGLIGYIQMETASSTGNNVKSNFFNENTFTFNADLNEKALEVYRFIFEKVYNTKK